MTIMTVNLCVREREPSVKYYTDSFQINKQEMSFPLTIDVKEVINLPNRKKKEYRKITKSFILTTISFLTLSSRSMAQTGTTQLQPSGTLGLPTEFTEPMLTLLILALAASFVLAMILMMGAGAMRMFRQKKFAVEWQDDIIKGFTTILLSIPVIFTLYYVAVSLLKVSRLFISPF